MLFWVSYFLFFVITSELSYLHYWKSILYWGVYTLITFITSQTINQYAITSLLDNKTIHFFLFSVVLTLAAAMITFSTYVLLFESFKNFVWNDEMSRNLIGPFIMIATTNVFISIFKVNRIKRELEKRNLLLQKDRLESELQFLRSQLNPHFLFNAINNIYFLIEQHPLLAKKTVLQFSETLWYQLYECTSEYIDIEKELLYL